MAEPTWNQGEYEEVKVDGRGERFERFRLFADKGGTWFVVILDKAGKPGGWCPYTVRKLIYFTQPSKAKIMSDLKTGEGMGLAEV